jgi:hypothetical protein
MRFRKRTRPELVSHVRPKLNLPENLVASRLDA